MIVTDSFLLLMKIFLKQDYGILVALLHLVVVLISKTYIYSIKAPVPKKPAEKPMSLENRFNSN